MEAETNTKDTQERIILRHLEHRPLTPVSAFVKYKIMRLSSRIFDLRAKGYNIETTRVKSKSGAIYGQYTLIKDNENTGS